MQLKNPVRITALLPQMKYGRLQLMTHGSKVLTLVVELQVLHAFLSFFLRERENQGEHPFICQRTRINHIFGGGVIGRGLHSKKAYK